MKKCFLMLAMALSLNTAIVQAQISEYTETGIYIANANDSKSDCVIKARELAMRQATEKAGVYIESNSKVVNNSLTHDEINAIYAGVVRIKQYGSEEFSLTEQQELCVKVTMNVEVDSDKIDQAINKVLELRQMQQQKNDYKKRALTAENKVTKLEERNKILEQNFKEKNRLEKKYEKATKQQEVYRDDVKKIHENNEALRKKEFLEQQIEEQKAKAEKRLQNYDDAQSKAEAAEKEKSATSKANKGSLQQDASDYFDIGRDKEYQQPKEAIEYYTKVITLKHNSYPTYYRRGMCYFRVNKYKEALKDFDVYLQSNPDLESKLETLYMRGACFKAMGQNFNAIHEYDEIIRLKPDMHRAYFGKGEAYRKQKLEAEAIPEYSQAIKLLEAFMEKEKSTKLYDYYEDGYKRRKSVYLFRRARCLKHNNRFEEALSDIKEAMQLYPHCQPFYRELVSLQIKVDIANVGKIDYTGYYLDLPEID